MIVALKILNVDGVNHPKNVLMEIKRDHPLIAVIFMIIMYAVENVINILIVLVVKEILNVDGVKIKI